MCRIRSCIEQRGLFDFVFRSVLRSACILLLSGSQSAMAICPPIVRGPGFYYDGVKYALTAESYAPALDLPEKISAEYEGRAHLVDWRELKAILSDGARLREFVSEIGIPLQLQADACTNFFVSNGGTMALDGKISLFARHDGKYLNTGYFVVDEIGDHTLDLGRWTHTSHALIAFANNDERSRQGVFDNVRTLKDLLGGSIGFALAIMGLIMIGHRKRGRFQFRKCASITELVLTLDKART